MSENKGFSLFERIYDPENIYHAWRKAKRIYDTEKDFISNLHEVVDFEVHLEDKISDLSSRIKNGTYSLSKMRPLWLPKVSEKPESRQNFEFSVEDQVVWLAVINIIGPILDDNMPFWSFGNRLYMPIWKETEKLADENGDKTVAKFGYYSSASPNLYRTWSSSWPLFRRAVSISIKTMAKHDYWSDDEETIMEDYANAPKSFKIQYWDKGYWNRESSENEIYYATIDLSKFYPSIHKKHIFNQEVNKLLRLDTEPREFHLLLDQLIDFQIITDAIQSISSNDPIIGIDLNTGKYNGIPTGLFVAGFLANMAMLPIDMEVTHILNEKRRIGHFRFVDDHVFIAYKFDDLSDWIEQYGKIIQSKGYQLQIKPEKTEPEAFKKWLCNKEISTNITKQELEEYKATAKKACKLDVHMPSPFTTLTLKKMSNINATPFDLMDIQEKMVMLQDIEHLLATEFPEGEIKKDTRASWAASLLIRLEPQINPFTEILYEKRQAYEDAINKLKDLEKGKDITEIERIKETPQYKAALALREEKNAQFIEQLDKAKKETDRLHYQVYLLIKRAISENIGKPKIWKKCFEYCRKVGLSPIDDLLTLINENDQLTLAGKQYLFCTIISSLCRNIIMSIKAADSALYSNSETKYASDFVLKTEAGLPSLIKTETSLYHCYDSIILLQHLHLAIKLYHIERCDELIQDKAKMLPLDFLWYYSPMMVTNMNNIPHFMDFVIAHSNKYKTMTIYKKLLLMFPSVLKPRKHNELLYEVYGVTPQMHTKRGMMTLEQAFIQQRNGQRCNDIVFMEWSILKIMERVIDLLKPKSFSLDFINTDFNYFNCSPQNFYIKKAINTYDTLEKLRNFFIDPKVIQKSLSPIRDMRFEGKFYLLSGEDFEKQQVYSCAILLLVLLRGSMDFTPMFARRSKYDRNYQTLLNLLDGLPFSSYTHAILLGAFNEDRFERRKHHALLQSSTGRTEERTDAPIVIENMDDFKREILGSIHTLEQYQLSLQNQTPRQLIPISLVNLTHQFNPYQSEEQENGTFE